MFRFKLEPGLRLLTAVRSGVWSLETVELYEVALRIELVGLRLLGSPTALIIDIRSGRPQSQDVARALKAMVERMRPLQADRVAVITISGPVKREARWIADPDAHVFTSMALARAWVTDDADPACTSTIVYDQPSDAEAEGPTVHVQGPADVDVTLTPAAALETAKRIANAAIEVLIATATPPEPPVA